VGRSEVVPDEVVNLLLAGIGCSSVEQVLAEGPIVGRVFAVLGALLAPLVVLLADVRIVCRQVLECGRASLIAS